MQQLRLFFAMALLYMFRVTILPIIRSTMLYLTFQVGRYTYVVISQYSGSLIVVGRVEL